jgi:hydrogenase expression/formation protein HypD
MRYIDEFRQKKLIQRVSWMIKEVVPADQIRIMEVCGTHTQSFFRFGLGEFLPSNIRLISGPGCPVCVSTQEYIDQTIQLAKQEGAIVTTFGDMLRLPGSHSSLEKEKANGADVRIVYSTLDSLAIAQSNPRKKIIFLAVGFETTISTIAFSIILAKQQAIGNIFFLTSLKLMPPALAYLLKDKRLNLDGLLCPGHVSAIIGLMPYNFIPRKFALPCCVAGFEPLDILEGIYSLLRQINSGKPRVDNQYSRVVTKKGNPAAVKAIEKVFQTDNAYWRGLGEIPGSGLKIKNQFAEFDAEQVFPLRKNRLVASAKQKSCRCADILKGLIIPRECGLFSGACTPEHPVGPCMVSKEGSCSIYYKYR